MDLLLGITYTATELTLAYVLVVGSVHIGKVTVRFLKEVAAL